MNRLCNRNHPGHKTVHHQTGDHCFLDTYIISQRTNDQKRDRSKATALLNVVEQNPNLDWNTRGEVLVKDSVIPFSHISDLVRDALHNSRYEPVGCNEFYSTLDNVPLSLISNPNRRILIGGKTLLPPPGIPDKKPVPLNNWTQLWKST